MDELRQKYAEGLEEKLKQEIECNERNGMGASDFIHAAEIKMQKQKKLIAKQKKEIARFKEIKQWEKN